MDLSKKDYDSLLKMIGGLKPGRELEGRIGRSKEAGNRTGYLVSSFAFENLLARLTFDVDNGGMGLPVRENTTLDVKQGDVRLRLTDLNSVKKYLILGRTDGLELSAVNSIEKNKSATLDIPEYSLRISVSDEGTTELAIKEIEDILKSSKPKIFRYKKQYAIVTTDGLFRYDLSIVKQVHSPRITQRDISRQESQYEIEVEYIGNNREALMEAQVTKELSGGANEENGDSVEVDIDEKNKKKNKKNTNKTNKTKTKNTGTDAGESSTKVPEKLSNEDILSRFIAHLGVALQAFQDSPVLSKSSERREVIENYMKHLKLDGGINPKTDFICPEPVTLHRRNVVKVKGQPSIMDGYAVSYKADGERNFLFFADGSKRVEDKGYFIDCNMRIKKSGWYNHGMAGTLIEGEFIRSSNLFLAYDVLFFKGQDVRDLPLERTVGEKISSSKDTNKTSGSRMEFLRQFFVQIKEMSPVKSLITANKTSGERTNVRDTLPTIRMKKHYVGIGAEIYGKAKELMENIKGLEYHVDGLIYTPLGRGYPKLERSNSNNKEAKNMSKAFPIFKWKPDHLNTIDFLIKIEKNPETGQDQRMPYYIPNQEGKLEDQVRQYKVLSLFVGGSRMNSGSGNHGMRREYTAVPFKPPKPANPEAGQAKVLLDDKGRMMAIDPLTGRMNEMKDDMIVEFAYHKDSLLPWRPIRVRYDKTERYKRGDPIYGNAEFVANDIWENINFPVSTDMVTTGDIPEANLKAPEKEVAQIQAETAPYYAMGNSERYPYQFFNNKVKNMLYQEVSPNFLEKSSTKKKKNLNSNTNSSMNTKANSMAGALLDLACGRGGDLHKWKMAKYKNVLGMDVDHDGLEEAQRRFNEMSKPKPYVKFIWADASKLIFPNYVAGMDSDARDHMKKVLVSKYSYDVVACQFAIHYFFRNEVTLRTFFQNVTDNLSVDGHLIGTCMDGAKVFELLKGKSSVSGKVGDSTLWTITKEYKNFKMDPTKAQYGKEIKVQVGDLGGQYTEYLVGLEFMQKMAGEYGLELVHYTSFADLYQDALKDENSPLHQSASQMNEDEVRYVGLNMAFVFQKKENAPDSVFKDLAKLMKKKGVAMDIPEKEKEKETVGEKRPRIRKVNT